jgi:parafibromin
VLRASLGAHALPLPPPPCSTVRAPCQRTANPPRPPLAIPPPQHNPRARGCDFLAVFHAAVRRQDEQLKGGGKDAAPSSRPNSGSVAAALAKPKVLDRSLGDGVVPIILVPSASQTLIMIYNVKEFLEDGVFMPSEERMRATKGGKPESVTV